MLNSSCALQLTEGWVMLGNVFQIEQRISYPEKLANYENVTMMK